MHSVVEGGVARGVPHCLRLVSAMTLVDDHACEGKLVFYGMPSGRRTAPASQGPDDQI